MAGKLDAGSYTWDAEEQECIQCLRQVTGSVEQPGDGDYDRRVAAFGRELRFSLSGYRRFSGVTLAVPLLGRPIAVVMESARSRVSGLPEVRVEDAELARRYRVVGSPPQAVAEALDEPTRRWLVQLAGAGAPEITTRGDFLVFYFPKELLKSPAAGGAPGPPATFSPQLLGFYLQTAVRMTDALIRSFDREHALVAQTQGPAAAQAWLSQAAERKRRGASVSNPRVLVLMVIILGVLAGCVVAAAAALHSC